MGRTTCVRITREGGAAGQRINLRAEHATNIQSGLIGVSRQRSVSQVDDGAVGALSPQFAARSNVRRYERSRSSLERYLAVV